MCFFFFMCVFPYVCFIFSPGLSINFTCLIMFPKALFLLSTFMHIRSFPRQILGMYAKVLFFGTPLSYSLVKSFFLKK